MGTGNVTTNVSGASVASEPLEPLPVDPEVVMTDATGSTGTTTGAGTSETIDITDPVTTTTGERSGNRGV